MKKFLLIIMGLLFVNFCFWEYNPTAKDQELLTKTYEKLDIIIKQDSSKAKQIMEKSQNIYTAYKHVDRIKYIFESIYKYILSQKTRTDDIPKNNELVDKNEFLTKHWSWFINNLPQICFDKFDIIDQIAKQEGIPTALIITTWKMEHNCYFDNTANWHGIFQIYSKNYGTGVLSEEWFKQQIRDFIAVAKWKINHYNNNKKYWTWNVNISYDKFDIDSIRIFAFLYNWVKKDKNPWNSEYVNWNLTPEIKYSKDWFILTFIKVLYREVNYHDKIYSTDNYRS